MPPPQPPSRPSPAGFIRPGDYTPRFLADALAAAPREPLAVLKSFWWYALRRRLRARLRLQEIVGRRLSFAVRGHLRTVAAPSPGEQPRYVAIVPATGATPPQRIEATLLSIPEGIATVVVFAGTNPPSALAAISLAVPGAPDIAALVNAAAKARGDEEVLLILHPGNVLLANAIAPLSRAFADSRVDGVIVDEVLALPDIVLPLLKPDFDEDLLLQIDYAGDFLAVRRSTFLALGGYREGREGTLARDFLLRLAAARGAGAIGHAPGAVHGRDLRGAEPDRSSACLASTEAHLAATAPGTTARAVSGSHRIEIVRVLRHPPPVTVIVPTRDRADLFVPCLDGLLGGTDYPHLEIIVADNGSQDPETLARFAVYAQDPRVRIAPLPGPFNFSRINNDAVTLARGQVLVFVNNDVEVLDPSWLTALVTEAVRPEVGAVGAKLLYPNRLVQHAGVVLGLKGGPAGHAFHLFRDDAPGYLHMLETTRRCSAVTAACLAVRREAFDEVGGFDAEAFPVALNDVDLCLRLDRAGYRNLYVPKACLLHKESASRPHDMSPQQRARYERELEVFSERWAERLAHDPWYNPGHGQAAADFSVPRWTDPRWPPVAPC